MAKPKPRADSGFALLFIFCMAAIVAILLLSATPRAAFEAERDQEQVLIDRGEQYKRAIQLYYRALHHYPPDLDQLEKSGNQRFLRRRYADPFTGKAEWRLIHVGPGGILTDSVNAKKKPASEGSVNNFITELQQVGGGDLTAGNGANVGLRRRASEAGAAGASVGQLNPNSDSTLYTRYGNGNTVPLPIGVNGQPSQGISPNGVSPAGVPPPQGGQLPSQNANQVVNNGYPDPTGTIGGGYPNPTGTLGGPPVSGLANYAGTPGAPVAPGPSVVPGGQGNNAAAAMIHNLLTSPRPGGYPGAQAGALPPGANQNAPPGAPATADATYYASATQGVVGTSQQANTTAFSPQAGAGAGIAGVASKDEHEGIKIYNEKTKHNEWEFIYDYGKEAKLGANLPGQQRLGQKVPPPTKP